MSKEAYFTSETLNAQSRRMQAALATYRRRHAAQVLHREAAALLVLDMQGYFLQQESHAFVPSAPAIVPGIRRLIKTMGGAGRLVLYSQHVNRAEDAGQMGAWWKDLIDPQAPQSKVIDELEASADRVFVKNQYDAFHGTSLDETLQSRGVHQVVITGVMTHLCCESTARSAFMRGYEVFFAIDGTATYTLAFHEAALLNLAHGFALPVLIDEVVEAFDA
jgi:isochorismate hydrolase